MRAEGPLWGFWALPVTQGIAEANEPTTDGQLGVYPRSAAAVGQVHGVRGGAPFT